MGKLDLHRLPTEATVSSGFNNTRVTRIDTTRVTRIEGELSVYHPQPSKHHLLQHGFPLKDALLRKGVESAHK